MLTSCDSWLSCDISGLMNSWNSSVQRKPGYSYQAYFPSLRPAHFRPWKIAWLARLGRHKVNGNSWRLAVWLALRWQCTIKLESILKLCAKIYSPTLLFVRLTVDYLMCTSYSESHPNTSPKRDSHKFPKLLSFHRTSLKPCLNYVLASALTISVPLP